MKRLIARPKTVSGYFLSLLLLPLVLACGTEKVKPKVVESMLADSADQIMFGADFNLTDRGIMRAQLNSDTAYFFDDNTRIELRPVKTDFFTVTGTKDAVLTSRKGTYNSRAGSMTAYGDVVVVNDAEQRRLTTQQLTYNQQANEISSDSAFVMTEPGRRLEGIGFRSDPAMRNVRILKTTSGVTGRVTIPGQ